MLGPVFDWHLTAVEIIEILVLIAITVYIIRRYDYKEKPEWIFERVFLGMVSIATNFLSNSFQNEAVIVYLIGSIVLEEAIGKPRWVFPIAIVGIFLFVALVL